MEHIYIICRVLSKLQLIYICSIRIRPIFEVIKPHLKAIAAEDDNQITNFPLYSLFPLSDRCRDIMVMRELSNPVIFYSATMSTISSFLKDHKDELSIGDCNAITGSVIVARLVFGLVAKASD